jgi:hypothetical protein
MCCFAQFLLCSGVGRTSILGGSRECECLTPEKTWTNSFVKFPFVGVSNTFAAAAECGEMVACFRGTREMAEIDAEK